MKSKLHIGTTICTLVLVGLGGISIPETTEARVPLSVIFSAAEPMVVLAKGTGGIKKPFNHAANPPKTPHTWTTKPRYPLWTGSNPPPPPAPEPKPRGFVTAKPTPPHSRLPQHFNYNAQRPMRFDFNRAAK